MDFGTKIRTILVFLTGIFDTCMLFNIFQTDNNIVKFIILVVNIFIFGYCAMYKNNNFTQEACEGTGYTRYKKAEKKSNGFIYTEPVDDDVLEVE